MRHPQRRARVFLLDAHTIFRAGVRSVLAEQPQLEVVGESGTFLDGVRQVVESDPDVMLVGVRETEYAELDLLREVRATRPGAAIVVLTRTDEHPALAAAARVGARAYLAKDLSVDDLVSTIDQVAAGKDLLEPEAVHEAVRAVGRRRDDRAERAVASLTPQERKILGLLAVGMSNKEIAENLFLVEKTVRNHVTRILAKLGVERRTQAALIAARLGVVPTLT